MWRGGFGGLFFCAEEFSFDADTPNFHPLLFDYDFVSFGMAGLKSSFLSPETDLFHSTSAYGWTIYTNSRRTLDKLGSAWYLRGLNFSTHFPRMLTQWERLLLSLRFSFEQHPALFDFVSFAMYVGPSVTSIFLDAYASYCVIFHDQSQNRNWS